MEKYINQKQMIELRENLPLLGVFHIFTKFDLVWRKTERK